MPQCRSIRWLLSTTFWVKFTTHSLKSPGGCLLNSGSLPLCFKISSGRHHPTITLPSSSPASFPGTCESGFCRQLQQCEDLTPALGIPHSREWGSYHKGYSGHINPMFRVSMAYHQSWKRDVCPREGFCVSPWGKRHLSWDLKKCPGDARWKEGKGYVDTGAKAGERMLWVWASPRCSGLWGLGNAPLPSPGRGPHSPSPGTVRYKQGGQVALGTLQSLQLTDLSWQGPSCGSLTPFPGE